LSVEEKVVVGRIDGLYGLHGWVKVYSYTRPMDNIVGYNPWYLKLAGSWRLIELDKGKRHGKTIIAKLRGFDDRNQANRLIGADIAISPNQLRVLSEGEFYWSQLIGLQVVNLKGEFLGIVEHIMETGANDVLVLGGRREVMVPFVQDDIIKAVRLEEGRIVADWETNWLE
jgi:16S rRNA processing protein RimM